MENSLSSLVGHLNSTRKRGGPPYDVSGSTNTPSRQSVRLHTRRSLGEVLLDDGVDKLRHLRRHRFRVRLAFGIRVLVVIEQKRNRINDPTELTETKRMGDAGPVDLKDRRMELPRTRLFLLRRRGRLLVDQAVPDVGPEPEVLVGEEGEEPGRWRGRRMCLGVVSVGTVPPVVVVLGVGASGVRFRTEAPDHRRPGVLLDPIELGDGK